jgi:heparan sulfate N-deacetylase/N-sulfotransferase NDST2
MQSGTEEENAGDELLFANRHKFWWFPHMWQHQQPHTFENTSNLVENMRLNKYVLTLHAILASSRAVY